ncbi:MAG: FG-GAP-like repeat-containing protein [Acidobacteriota bacterium]
MNVNRLPRMLYNTLTNAFAPAYQPPIAQTAIFRATSAGCAVPSTSCGFAKFFKSNGEFYSASGGGGGGRGFNVVVIDPCTGAFLHPPQNFDTWGTRTTGTAMTNLTNFLDGLSNGGLVMLAVGDEAGLTQDNSCTHFSFPWIEPFYQALEALGSTQIRNYCFRNSWAIVAVKGEGVARSEQLANAVDVSAQTMLSLQSAISPASRAFASSAGSGTISVTVPNECNWTAVANNDFITINSGSGGIGNGIVTYFLEANTGPVRTGTMTVAGHVFTVTQAQAGASGGRTPFEFDGDTKTELAVWRPSDGFWYIINSSTGGGRFQGWGLSTDKLVPADYDGDGKTDLAIWRPSDGNWWIINSSDGSVRIQNWGLNGDVPVPADYDGDGKADLAVWRPSDGFWYIINSSTGGGRLQGWGVSTDKVVPGDYDGDGKADLAIWRPSDGNWWIINSSNGSVRIQNWGINGDVPAPGDYDGDGKTDLAVWRPSDGFWYIINSSTGGGRLQGWGVSTDELVPGDYDGDGKTDLAIWRPSDGNWWIINSSNGSVKIQNWGINGDVPVPSVFIR